MPLLALLVARFAPGQSGPASPRDRPPGSQVAGFEGGEANSYCARGLTGLFGTIGDVERPHVKLSGDIEGTYVVEETRSDGRLVISPDTSAQAIMDRLGHEPATLAEFEAEYGRPVKPPDGEG